MREYIESAPPKLSPHCGWGEPTPARPRQALSSGQHEKEDRASQGRGRGLHTRQHPAASEYMEQGMKIYLRGNELEQERDAQY